MRLQNGKEKRGFLHTKKFSLRRKWWWENCLKIAYWRNDEWAKNTVFRMSRILIFKPMFPNRYLNPSPLDKPSLALRFIKYRDKQRGINLHFLRLEVNLKKLFNWVKLFDDEGPNFCVHTSTNEAIIPAI